jgi:ABC-2 type transport system ATP-binding protein
MISIRDVSRRFGRIRAVDHVSLEIPAGDSVALWGANGAGKTTLLRCALGLLRFSGRASIGGHDVLRRGRHARMLIGCVPQELGFYDELRVAEALRFFASLRGIRLASAAELLDRAGLAGHQRQRIRELSGGQKQRLALVIALLGDPPVLVLDEVTASLDALGRSEFVSQLTSLSGLGRTILFASHRIEEVTALARRVVVLDRGRVAAVDDTERFVERLGVSSVLHLALPAAARGRAAELLRERGFEARINGAGLIVPISPGQRAAPFRVLAEARIAIEDFELLAMNPGSRSPERTEAQA